MCSENFRIFLYNKNDLIIMIGKTMKCIILKTFFLIILFSTANLNAQYYLVEPAPLLPENSWLYMADFGREKFYYKVLDSIVTIDSLDYYVVEGYSYINGIAIGGPYYQYNRVDTLGFYYSRGNIFFDSSGIYYKKNAQLHDAWVNLFFTGIPAYYEIIDTGTYNWSGNIIKYNLLKITDSSLVEEYQYWSEEFGLLEAYDAESPPEFLIGCVIDGIAYGDTTVVSVEEENYLVKDFKFYQNYPNPFNPNTTISFSIPQQSL